MYCIFFEEALGFLKLLGFLWTKRAYCILRMRYEWGIYKNDVSGGLLKLVLASLIGFKIRILRGRGLLISLMKPSVCAGTREVFSKARFSLAFFMCVDGHR